MTSAPSLRKSWADFLRDGSLEIGKKPRDNDLPPTVPPPPRFSERRGDS